MNYTIMFEDGERTYSAETKEEAINMAHADGNPIGIRDETERKLEEFDRLWYLINKYASYIFLAFAACSFVAGFWKTHQFYLSAVCLTLFIVLRKTDKTKQL